MLRETLKNLLAGLLYSTGILTMLARRKFRHQALVLTYHRVLPRAALQESYSHPAIIVTPDVFERHIAILNRYFTCLGLDEFNDRFKRQDFSGGAYCLITFDDAWQDNHTHAFDVLKRSRTPAVIFVPVDYIGSGKLFWQERLGHIVDSICTHPPETAARILEKHGWGYLPALPRDRRSVAIRSAIRDIKHKDYAEIERIIADLETVLDEPMDDYGPDNYLGVAQMREMAGHGISFQSHACSHRILPRLSVQEVEHELAASRQWLRDHLDIESIALAYPNGDHSPRVRQLAAEAGYQLAFTTVNGCVDPRGDPFAVRRINLSSDAAGSEARLLLTLLVSG